MAPEPAIRQGMRMDGPPILICYDGSPEAARAIEVAAGLLGKGRAVVLDVGPEITPTESLATLSPVAPGAAFEELNLDDASRVAAQGAQLARTAGFEAEARSALDAPTWDGVVSVADELDAPVIVTGSRGLNALQERLEGSVSHAVAEHAGRPVLIVPPPHDQP
jgi:nucleotide-binding universal stress UspA family protein